MFFAKLARPWKCQTTKKKKKKKKRDGRNPLNSSFVRVGREEKSTAGSNSSVPPTQWVFVLCCIGATTRINRAVYNKYTRRQRGKKVKGISVWQMGNPVVP